MQYTVEYDGHYFFNPTYIHEEGKSEPVLIYKNVVYFTVDNRGVHHYHQTYSGEFQDPEQMLVSGGANIKAFLNYYNIIRIIRLKCCKLLHFETEIVSVKLIYNLPYLGL